MKLLSVFPAAALKQQNRLLYSTAASACACDRRLEAVLHPGNPTEDGARAPSSSTTHDLLVAGHRIFSVGLETQVRSRSMEGKCPFVLVINKSGARSASSEG